MGQRILKKLCNQLSNSLFKGNNWNFEGPADYIAWHMQIHTKLILTLFLNPVKQSTFIIIQNYLDDTIVRCSWYSWKVVVWISTVQKWGTDNVLHELGLWICFHDLLHWKENPISKIPECKPHQQLQAQKGKKKQIITRLRKWLHCLVLCWESCVPAITKNPFLKLGMNFKALSFSWSSTLLH